jgi:hypothetical protein
VVELELVQLMTRPEQMLMVNEEPVDAVELGLVNRLATTKSFFITQKKSGYSSMWMIS